MVLSGMGNMAMMEDNLRQMDPFRPLDEKEQAAVEQVCAILKAKELIPCTGCRYCTEPCPRGIAIPELFACLNSRITYKTSWNSAHYYSTVHQAGTRASDCIGCGACEAVCPQHLPIRELLGKVAGEFEK
jgi:predicted aldo/keto reductase-like oxidoreductase